MKAAILIPAYKPGSSLVCLLTALLRVRPLSVVIVDDGSGPDYRHHFDACARHPSVTILRHAVNLGKGTALKTGLNHILCASPAHVGVVTADADGQHHPDDIVAVLDELTRQPDSLILGVRNFAKDVPWRSRLGNLASREILWLVVGRMIRDTQTGLRGLPFGLLPKLLRIPAAGYEFELDMLITAKHHGCRIVQVPIQTIYLNGNESSHFNPVFDSMRIYFVLVRFGLVSALTALIDNAVFVACFRVSQSLAGSQILGRLLALCFNYWGARRAVFLTREKHSRLLPRYLSLVIANGVLSYALIRFVTHTFGLSVIVSKVLAESFLFLANFIIQRDFVFSKKGGEDSAATDWARYYRSVPPTARLTRRYTTRILCRILRNCLRDVVRSEEASVVELGGANSCFLDAIRSRCGVASYCVVDNNEFGMSLLRERKIPEIDLQLRDVREPLPARKAHVAFSVGLIEHFSVQETRRVLQAHFDVVRPGGYVVLSFPTATFLYRLARATLESFGLWNFPDERPLERAEVLETVRNHGELIYEKLLWPLILTQRILVIRKHDAVSPPVPEEMVREMAPG